MLKNHAIVFLLKIDSEVCPDGKKRRSWYVDYPDGENGEPKIIIKYGKFDENAVGYVYTLPSDSFEQDMGKERQWFSFESVSPIGKPELVYAKDYKKWVMREEEYEK